MQLTLSKNNIFFLLKAVRREFKRETVDSKLVERGKKKPLAYMMLVVEVYGIL